MVESERPEYWPSFLSSMRLSRADVFGPADEQLPISEVSDSYLPQIGFIGANYHKGGDLLLAINPGGGGDAYRRTMADASLLPIIAETIRKGPSESAEQEIFQRCCQNMRTWNLWRIVAPVLEACGREQQDIAYLNWCPFRTRRDQMPRTTAMMRCREAHVAPLIKALAPDRVIALGMKVGGWVGKESFSSVQTYVVPRTNGDRYLCDKALLILEELRQSTNKRAIL